MSQTKRRLALVTGCSSGIGRATARLMHDSGFQVYATARKVEDIADLSEIGIQTAALDVLDEGSMSRVLDDIGSEHGGVHVLVNNAGYELAGSVEECPLDEVRRQFEVNFFGAVRLTRHVVPLMREHRTGRIINVSSVFGRFAVPGRGFYAASKQALDGMSESLRLELEGFGIRVVLVEPTATRTPFLDNAILVASPPGSPYDRLRQRIVDWNQKTYSEPAGNIAGKMAVTADHVARVITRAAMADRPRARYPVGVLAHGLFFLRRWLPRPAFDAFVRSQFPTP